MKNVLKVADYPKGVWRYITDDYEVIEEEHRRGSSFYTTAVVHIDEEMLEDEPILAPYPELVGSFMTLNMDMNGMISKLSRV